VQLLLVKFLHDPARRKQFLQCLGLCCCQVGEVRIQCDVQRRIENWLRLFYSPVSLRQLSHRHVAAKEQGNDEG
jgi:hypothetical protein